MDDDPGISKALGIRLRAYGVEVDRAFNGMQGYWMALKRRPDVIVADYMMPEGQGNYLLERLKNHPLTKNIPVIVLTGRTVEGRKDGAIERLMLDLGAVRLLTKPVDFEVLLAELRRFIELPAAADMPVAG
ncbi:MAG: response regulator [Planctomycetes bacterium]|nr:response regulator [Planctomycetota bacterium]